MRRYDTVLDDDTLFVEADSRLEVGTLSDIYDLVGGETYTIEYDERQRTVGWLDTDADGRLTFDVRETLADLDFNEEFVRSLRGVPIDETNEDGYPPRTAVFADLLTSIWDSKGTVEL